MRQSLALKSGWFTVQARTAIQAPVERVWSILTDLEKYHEWDSFVPSMQSDFQVGSLLTMHVQMRENFVTTSVETITAIEPEHLLAWKIRSPAWFLRGERLQELKPIDAGTTEYFTCETFTGLFAPVLQFMYARDLQHGFDAVARDLKVRAETVERRNSVKAL
ncbi:hypothetical protein KSD_02790 [Ktedonobacter sp. SOSP1-85]|uniref:SRPBCC domain-containing protein n=1 Tax=Ktedonobacter sp. SOSP1-85 TaxID=2778367 RepID=UPI00191673D7|nr:SRPBCC domain-containing protein [Ktedonobacter sp. SOSP1-85]GHO72508.1 hypothetical protein KSD_02790 [Ktedonobacter sp. SOSP1-85]